MLFERSVSVFGELKPERINAQGIPIELCASTTNSAMMCRPRLYSSPPNPSPPHTEEERGVRHFSNCGGLWLDAGLPEGFSVSLTFDSCSHRLT
jgi:hypothetical protein